MSQETNGVKARTSGAMGRLLSLKTSKTLYLGAVLATFALVSLAWMGSALPRGPRVRLDGSVIDVSGIDCGKAQFEQKGSGSCDAVGVRCTFSAEIQDQAPNSRFDVSVDIPVMLGMTMTISLGSGRTDATGFADFNLDTDEEDTVPTLPSGTRVIVQMMGGATLTGGLQPN